MDEIREKFILVMFCVLTLISYSSAVEGPDTLSLGTYISGNQTIISKSGTFELGFFTPNGTNNSYIGIWYADLAEETVVWVANRETPSRNRSGILKLSKEGDLGLVDATGVSRWSVNVTKKASHAVILDTGNFVLFSDDNKSEILWQSFDNPADNWLSGMRFGGQQKLVCWKNSFDPAPGLFSFHADPSGAKQFVLTWNNSVQYWTSGIWDGNSFTQLPAMTIFRGFYNLSVEDTESSFYVTYSLMDMKSSLSRLVLVMSGEVQRFSILPDGTWNPFWSAPRDECDVYALCGAYGSRDSNNLQFCSCVDGFTPKDNRSWNSRESWSSGCIRESSLNCNPKNGSTDIFLEPSETLRDTNSASSVHPAITTQKDCEKACLLNCSCTAYTFISPSGPCQIWSGDLLNMHKTEFKSNSNLFIRVAAPKGPKFHPKGMTTSIVLGLVAAAAIVVVIFSILVWRRHRQRHLLQIADYSNSVLRMFSYVELKIATRNFRSKLGSGGFGTVYKGQLIDGTLVAVKKMESSRQDEKQFRAEISSLGNIQHANLVRLRGFCVERSTRFLVYDYMPNGSLNSLLFSRSSKEGKEKGHDWKSRFEIALGTARALVYLHEECRDCIIHCDVKPENILLDNDLSPKLADFGLAKLLGRDFSRVLTTTRGTRGYLAPEWISGLPTTPKVDVYSFGMTLLEIISGRRNLDLNVKDPNQYYFPSWAATQIHNGNTITIVGEGIVEEIDIEEVRRASIVSLLCIESDEEARPSMRQVVLMLEGKVEVQTQLPIQCSPLMDGQAHSTSIDIESDD